MNGHFRESSSASDTCGADRPSSMKQLFTSRWPNKDGSAAPSSSQTESHAATEEKTERRRPSMEKEESLRLVDVNTCSAESSTSVLTTDDQAGELTLKMRPQALGGNTLHNSSSLFSQKMLDAIQRDAEQGTNSISNFDYISGQGLVLCNCSRYQGGKQLKETSCNFQSIDFLSSSRQ